MNSMLLFLSLTLMAASDNDYQKAETEVSRTLAVQHEDENTFFTCGDKIKTVIYKDSMLNKKGSVGAEYNYPIYRYETEITYYKDMKIAAVEKREIKLKRYEYEGVTTGIQIIASLDSLNTYYFDQAQQPITHAQMLEIQAKICKEKD